MPSNGEVTGERRVGTWGSVVVGTLATFGVLVSAAVAGVVVAGGLQWTSGITARVDDAIPLVVLALGMVLCGRVAADVAGHRGAVSAAGVAALVGALGMAVSRSSEAHGDAIEPWQVAVASLTVLLVVGGTAELVIRRRTHR